MLPPTFWADNFLCRDPEKRLPLSSGFFMGLQTGTVLDLTPRFVIRSQHHQLASAFFRYSMVDSDGKIPLLSPQSCSNPIEECWKVMTRPWRKSKSSYDKMKYVRNVLLAYITVIVVTILTIMDVWWLFKYLSADPAFCFRSYKGTFIRGFIGMACFSIRLAGLNFIFDWARLPRSVLFWPYPLFKKWVLQILNLPSVTDTDTVSTINRGYGFGSVTDSASKKIF